MTQKEEALIRAKFVKNLKKLRLEDKVNSEWSVRDIIIHLFENPLSTIHVNSGRKQYTGGSRSITDTYRVVSFYHPEIKIYEVINEIIGCRFRSRSWKQNVRLFPYYCSYVRKCVFNKSAYGSFIGSVKTEFGLIPIVELIAFFKKNDI